MKFEEKGRKKKNNTNCELSHMIRPAESLEVYKQKQNILFIYESVEHRKVQGDLGKTVGVLGRMHGRVLVSSVCTAECSCRVYARLSVCVEGAARWSVTTAWTGVRRGGS